ncbi:unnamed protein product, partial [Mesorhabditis spiculigera]
MSSLAPADELTDEELKALESTFEAIDVKEAAETVGFASIAVQVFTAIGKNGLKPGMRFGKAEVAKLYAGTTAESFEEDLVRKPGTGRPKRLIRERSPSPSTAKPKMLTRSKREDATKEYPPCVRCKCTSFRVVDPGRPDRKRVIECRNMDCLASIAYTELEEGELLGAQEEVEYGWYLRDWEEIYYPKVNEEQRWIGSLCDIPPATVTIRRDADNRPQVMVPFQRQLVSLL